MTNGWGSDVFLCLENFLRVTVPSATLPGPETLLVELSPSKAKLAFLAFFFLLSCLCDLSFSPIKLSSTKLQLLALLETKAFKPTETIRNPAKEAPYPKPRNMKERQYIR